MGTQGRGIVLMPPDIAWFGCYECGMTLKARTVTRRWNPGQKCWTLSTRELATAWAVLKDHHPEALIVNADGEKQPEPEFRRTQNDWWQEQRKRNASTPAKAASRSWAELMFEQLPEHLHGDAFRALMHVLHPDKNGDAEAMDALVKARERKRGAA